MRLTGSSKDTAGRLELCYEGRWGTVCDDSVTNITADVVCRQLSHAALGIQPINYYFTLCLSIAIIVKSELFVSPQEWYILLTLLTCPCHCSLSCWMR